MTPSERKELQILACKMRMDILSATHAAKSGHPGGSMSATELFAYLYNKELNIDPADPKKADRDRFVLSKGHCAPCLYAILAELGFFSKDEFINFRQLHSILQGHPDMKKIPGVDASTGSLGQGISIAVGMALGAKYQGKDTKVFTILGDGEINEGTVWEALMAAVKFKADNLCAILDWNGVQLDGTTEEVMPMGDIPAKFKAFGWNTIECDGHDLDSVYEAVQTAKTVKGVPTIILAHTVKGKGVSFMEGKNAWHGKPINDEEYALAMAELGGAK